MKKENQDEVQHLEREEAIEKMKELVGHNSICIFTTNLAALPLTTRPMSAQQVDDDGAIWFLSASDSDKNREISRDQRVQLFFSNNSASEYMSVYGRATILVDQNKIEEVWTPIAKAWFTEGKDDPRVSLIKVTPLDAYYWDTKNGKMVSMIKILASAVTGKTIDEGVEGHLAVGTNKN